jgi:hypothetical protein
MTRTWIATAIAVCLQASTASAQVQHFTVSTPSASVYKAPTNVSPVIGQATKGATLEVTRDVGSWVKVAWSKAPDGVGYIRKAEGAMSTLGAAVPAAAAPRSAAAAPAPLAAGASAPPASATPHSASAQTVPGVRPQSAPLPSGYVAPTHRFGVGGLVGGSAAGAGLSLRGWSASQRFGVQFDVTRYSMSDDVFFTRGSATQFGPRLLYAFRDRVSDRTWVRPYAGAGAHVLRSSVADPGTGLSVSDTAMAAQIFGGAEITVAAVPRLGLSADVGYVWHESPFAGSTVGGTAVTLSAHWYVK